MPTLVLPGMQGSPWSGRLINIHHVIDKGIAVFHCSLTTDVAGRWLEIRSGCSTELPVRIGAPCRFRMLNSPACVLWPGGWHPSQREAIGAASDSQEGRCPCHVSSRHISATFQQEETGYTAPDTDGAHSAPARRPRKRRELLAAEGGR
jgi:hypothetical protein